MGKSYSCRNELGRRKNALTRRAAIAYFVVAIVHLNPSAYAQDNTKNEASFPNSSATEDNYDAQLEDAVWESVIRNGTTGGSGKSVTEEPSSVENEPFVRIPATSAVATTNEDQKTKRCVAVVYQQNPACAAGDATTCEALPTAGGDYCSYIPSEKSCRTRSYKHALLLCDFFNPNCFIFPRGMLFEDMDAKLRESGCTWKRVVRMGHSRGLDHLCTGVTACLKCSVSAIDDGGCQTFESLKDAIDKLTLVAAQHPNAGCTVTVRAQQCITRDDVTFNFNCGRSGSSGVLFKIEGGKISAIVAEKCCLKDACLNAGLPGDPKTREFAFCCENGKVACKACTGPGQPAWGTNWGTWEAADTNSCVKQHGIQPDKIQCLDPETLMNSDK